MESALQFDGLTIEWRQKSIKNIHLRVYPPDGRITLSTPKRLSAERAHHYLETKREWLHQTRQTIQKNHTITRYETGSRHYYLGNAYPLTRSDSENHKTLVFNEEGFFLNSMGDEQTKAAFIVWYREQFQVALPPLVEKWQRITGKSVSNINIKPMRTRWGSCNIINKRLSLNLSLIQKPLACIEYVLVHELVHLFEAKHNQRFYQHMDFFLPNWKAVHHILEKKNQSHD